MLEMDVGKVFFRTQKVEYIKVYSYDKNNNITDLFNVKNNNFQINGFYFLKSVASVLPQNDRYSEEIFSFEI